MPASTERCDREIFEKGTSVFVTHTLRTSSVESWVQLVATLSGQRVDWSWMGGRAVVRALGDLQKVRAAIVTLRPEHDERMLKALQGLRLPGDNDEQDAKSMQGIWDFNSYLLMGADEEYGSEMMRLWQQASEERNEARAALRKYGAHQAGCDARGRTEYRCPCGYQQELAKR